MSLKRVFDAGASGALLVVLSPVMTAIAASILVESGRPVLFKQARVGKDGIPFDCLKFRSMVQDAAKQEAKLREEHYSADKLWKIDNDPRVTKLGAFLRRTSLDELPQLINVFLGQMSLVGPRPKQAWELAELPEISALRQSVRPGITGPVQVSGRTEIDSDVAYGMDLQYIENNSFIGDFTILLRTVREVFGRSSGR